MILWFTGTETKEQSIPGSLQGADGQAKSNGKTLIFMHLHLQLLLRPSLVLSL